MHFTTQRACQIKKVSTDTRSLFRLSACVTRGLRRTCAQGGCFFREAVGKDDVGPDRTSGSTVALCRLPVRCRKCTLEAGKCYNHRPWAQKTMLVQTGPAAAQLPCAGYP
ncbi:hypothetical protein J6590_040611 [Homalodisca vitripennis]|nr:hypothetical protein J6590_040611 [Homalodisca vitripennis]